MLLLRSKASYIWWCAFTVLLSAFLLFEVQPVISKAILPWFGGSPAVWLTCMLFFQLLLLGGYAYAHALTLIKSQRTQMILHCVLLLAAVAFFPITPDNDWKPTGSQNPAGQILLLLLAHVGLPYFMLSSTGPLVQSWFAGRFPDGSPYRLYALSNIGSLMALLTYPFLVEPVMTVNAQGLTWSLLFVGFAAFSGILAVSDWQRKANRSGSSGQPGSRSQGVAFEEVSSSAPAEDAKDKPTFWRYVTWIALPALASVLLLSITTHVCQDVAVVPFLWVAPLSLYLLTFIICFDNESWYIRPLFGFLGFASTIAIGMATFSTEVDAWLKNTKLQLLFEKMFKSWFEFPKDPVSTYADDIVVQVVIFLGALFFLCMMCHGELVRSKPKPRYLTIFYLCVSAGGALGGAIVSLVAPAVFSSYIELPVAIMLACGVSIVVVFLSLRRAVEQAGWGTVTFLGFLFVVTAEFSWIIEHDNDEVLASVRNFYGVLRVEATDIEDPEAAQHKLYHGRILHGTQFLQGANKTEPTTYYVRNSGPGVAVKTMRSLRGGLPLRIGVIGLGTGTMAAYGQQGDTVHFYEINPLVKELAGEYFTYLSDAKSKGANIEIAEGDARISMEREDPQKFDVLVIDAFSGDAIPTHLVTSEAIEIYAKHLRKDGIIAVHISNRYLELYSIVYNVAKYHSYEPVSVEYDEDAADSATQADPASSDWLLLTKGGDTLKDPNLYSYFQQTPEADEKVGMWTDQFSNLYKILITSDESKKRRKNMTFFVVASLSGLVFIGLLIGILRWKRKPPKSVNPGQRGVRNKR